MGRTQSASTSHQQTEHALYGNLVDAEQVKGVYYGSVLQTDISLGLGSLSPIPVGMMTVNIPSLGVNYVSEPLPYPGGSAPELGAQVSVGFDDRNNPIVLAIYGNVIGITTTVPVYEVGMSPGSMIFVNGLLTEYIAPSATTPSGRGWGSYRWSSKKWAA